MVRVKVTLDDSAKVASGEYFFKYGGRFYLSKDPSIEFNVDSLGDVKEDVLKDAVSWSILYINPEKVAELKD